MDKEKIKNAQRKRRRNHVRNKVRGSAGVPRLCVCRTNKHIYCQLIDDENGLTLASASTRDNNLRSDLAVGSNRDAAKRVGQAIAERAKQAGISAIRFDRGHYKYHGRVAELADAARESGLKF